MVRRKTAELEAKILEVGAGHVAAFIAEPILASGGVIVPPEGYHKRCLGNLPPHDVLYISDEVVTAFGRLGEFLHLRAFLVLCPISLPRQRALPRAMCLLAQC